MIDYFAPSWGNRADQAMTALLPQDVVFFISDAPRCWPPLVPNSKPPRVASDLDFFFRQAFLVRKCLGAERGEVLPLFRQIWVIFARSSPGWFPFQNEFSHDAGALDEFIPDGALVWLTSLLLELTRTTSPQQTIAQLIR